MKQAQSGLAGVIAGDSAISTVSTHGTDTGLLYRGYSIEELAAHACFEEVAYLLIYRELPTPSQLHDYQRKLASLRTLPKKLAMVLEIIPDTANPMDVLRTTCSMLGTLEPEGHEHTAFSIADRLLALLPGALLYWYHFHHNHKRIDIALPTLSTAAYFLELLQQKPAPAEQNQALDVSLILYAEHEFNASTFAARVTTATLTDFYSAICAAIGTLRGPLHGGANEEVLRMLQNFSSTEEAEAAIHKTLANKGLVMGFGHRVYRQGDPRSNIIKQWAEKLTEERYQQPEFTQQFKRYRQLLTMAINIEQLMWQEKKLFANLDFFTALTYHYCHIPIELFTPIFVLSRVSGWSAHIIEQRSNNKLIRPLAHYIGPQKQTFIPIDRRD